MVTLGEVLRLATPLGAIMIGVIMGKFGVAWVSRLLENTFAAIVQLMTMSDTDTHSKAQPQSPCTFM